MMSSERWKFTVVVPSWTTHTIENESVVLYRVEVRVQVPDADRQSSRSVLRRYSDFRRLHAALKARLPGLMKGKEAPAKQTLLRVNSSVEQIERRRRDLEKWLWKLLGDPEIGRTSELAAFLELQAAASHGPRHTYDHPHALGATSSAGGSSDRPYSESTGTNDEDLLEHGSTTGSDLASVPESAGLEHGHSATLQPQAFRAGGGRAGLRIEQRPVLRKLVAELYDRLEKAKSDMEDAVESAECERRARETMAERLADAMEELQAAREGSGGAAPPEGGEAGTDRAASNEALMEALEAERQTVAQLKQDLEEKETGLKADMKVLAKEVKKLRKENAGLVARAEDAEAAVAAAKVGSDDLM